MDEIDKIAAALWGLFRAEIGTGEPVFFCFSQETLKERLAASGIDGPSPLLTVCAAANACFDVEGHRVALKHGSLSLGAHGVSKAIILVCQQILAVEEMARDSSQYSENAYFPRLRKLMGAGLMELSVNPFEFEEFEAIWRTFAREVGRVPGSSNETITFEFGRYTGVNKARLFPLSQALLSRADLSELVNHCRANRLRESPTNEVWSEIRRERIHLSRRGQRLVNSGFLRERIVEQVQNFARRTKPPGSIGVMRPVHRVDQLDLVISLDITDWTNEEYRAVLVVRETGRRLEDDRKISEKLNGLLSDRGFIFCALSDLEDCWMFRDGEVEVGAGQPLLLVARGVGMQRGQALLDGLSPPVAIDQSRTRSLGAAAAVFVFPVLLPLNLRGSITIRAGRVVANNVSSSGLGQYEWVGGICLDTRSRKYLRQMLPTSVRFGDKEFRISDLTRVGEFGMSWDSFVQAIAKLQSDASYDLRFPNGKTARLSVAVAKYSSSERVGFPIEINGLLSPTLDSIGESDAAVIGFTAPAKEFAKPADTRAIANLLRDFRGRLGRQLTVDESRQVWLRVEASAVPASVKRLIEGLLDRKATVEDSTLRELLLST